MRRLVACVAAAVLVSCGGGGSPAAEPPDVSSGDPPQPPEAPAEPDLELEPLPVHASPHPFPAPPRGQWAPLQSDVPRFDLEIAPDDLDRLLRRIGDRALLVPGRFTASGRTYDVQVRIRGRSTRFRPKKSFQVRFAEGEAFEGRRRLELLAQWRDGGLVTEKLWYDLAHAAGLRVPRVRYVGLHLNGAFYGVMAEVERVDKPFLAAHAFDDLDASVYRCGWKDCELRDRPGQPWQEPWTKRTNEREPWDDLHDLLRVVNRTPPADLTAALEGVLDVDAYLTWLAVDALIANAIQGDSRSFLVRDRVAGKWIYVPWDLNNARSVYDRNFSPERPPLIDRKLFAFSAYDATSYDIAEFSRDNGLVDPAPVWSVLSTRVYDDPQLRARLVSRLRELLETHFRVDVLGPRADAIQALLAPHLARDAWVDPAFPPRSAAFVRRFVAERRSYVIERLGRIAGHGAGPLRIGRVGLGASGGPVLELCNAGDAAVVAEGFVTGDPRDTRQVPLPPTTVPAGASVQLSLTWPAVAASLSGSFPEAAVFAPDGRTAVDIQWMPPLSRGEGLARPRGCAEPPRFGSVGS